MTNVAKKKIKAISISLLFSTIAIFMTVIPIYVSSRAILISPRFGSPLRTSFSLGNQSTGYLSSEIAIEIGTDPADVKIPANWLKLENWDIGISSSYLEKSPIIISKIKSISKTSNSFVSHGHADSSKLYTNAITIKIKIPSYVDPGLYHLHVAYKNSLNNVTLSVSAGDFRGVVGSASNGADPFILNEANCIYIPSSMDANATDTQNIKKIPFSLIHISDIHVGYSSQAEKIPSNYYRLLSLMQGISVFAPDIVIGSGDLTNSPDDRPSEYPYAYNMFREMGIPFFAGNGNHDAGNLGMFQLYFGPIQHSVQWGGTRFIGINSVLPPSGSSLEWVIKNIQQGAVQDESVFLVDHYPIMDILDREMQSSVGSILGAMLEYNSSGVLNGHNHYNIIYDMEKAYSTYNTMGNMQAACDIPENVGNIAPIVSNPKIFLTTSASAGARSKLNDEGIWNDYVPYLGYRRITIVNNQIKNYTYDYNEDGKRDPSYGYPTEFAKFGGVNRTLSYDSTDLFKGAQFKFINNLTESIPWARAAITLPKPSGYTWTPIDTSLLVRTKVSNGTHDYLDIRASVPARTNVPSEFTINLILKPYGGI
jgi:3',5'-cyclic AMP phosphodiesterase CpdA